MKRSALSFAALVAAFFLIFSCAGFAQSAAQPGEAPHSRSLRGRGPKYAPDHVLVRFRARTSKEAAASVHAAVGAQVLRRYALVDGLQLVRLAPGMTVPQAIHRYRQDPAVLYAEPDYARHIDNTPNDPQWGSLWGMTNIRAPQAWDLSTGSSTVVVGVIDTGADTTHPDLAANLYSNTVECNGAPNTDNDGNGFKNDCHGANAITDSGDPLDDNGHGTHVAGIIGAVGNNGTGVVGVNWTVRILPCKALDASGWGYDSYFIQCLEYLGWMYDHGARIVAINASWGGAEYSQSLSDAIASHIYRGILVFASAGDDSTNLDSEPAYPASFFLANLVTVAAIDSSSQLADFSNFGERTVHLSAPGVNILSTLPGNQYASLSGTSMATPHVAGVAALLAAQQPWRDWTTIRNLILAGGASPALVHKSVTGKRLDAYGAMTCLNSPVAAILRPAGRFSTTTTYVGGSVLLAALNINCAAPAGNVVVSVSPGGGTVTLRDDGANGDQVAGDGIYSGLWTAPAAGLYTFTFPWGDTVSVKALSSYSPTTAVYQWRFVCTGNPLLTMDDDTAVLVSPGFPVRFGGALFDSFYVSSNGTISFDGAFTDWSPDKLPTPDNPTLVAPWWDDLHPIAGDSAHTVYWQTWGTAPNRELVVGWCAVPHYGYANPSENVTFEVVMFENSSDVLFQYQDTTFGGSSAAYDHGLEASVGVQTGTTVGYSSAYRSAVLTDGLALRFTTSSNPVPALAAISPATAPAGSPAFELTLTGNNFVPASVVRWNGLNRTTYYDGSGRLRASIPAGDIAGAGLASVTVFNPTPGGGTSAARTFTIGGANPAPSITSIDPQSIAGGLAPLTLTVHGSGFVPASAVMIAGYQLPATHYVDAGTLTIPLSNAYHALSGTWPVQVFNPAPGGGSSNSVTFEVTSNTVPDLVLLSPAGVAASGSGFTLWVTGWYFAPGAVVMWNGSPRDTQRLDATHLTASIAASDIATPGTAAISVANPAPGGGASAPLTFTILIAENYSLTVTPNPLSMSQQTSEAVALKVTALGSFTDTVHLACRAPLPAGMSCAFNQNDFVPSSAGTAVTLTVGSTASTPLGANVIHLDVTGGSPYVPARTTDLSVNLLTGLRFFPVNPCRVADTRAPVGPFGGPFLRANASRAFGIPYAGCGIPSWAQAYSVNLTVVPHGSLGYLTAYPCGQPQPLASNLNAPDGRIKAVAAIVPAGSGGAMCVFSNSDTDLVIDINGYFVPNTEPSALAFYPMTPCRLVDTRQPNAPLGGPFLAAGAVRTFPVLGSPCNPAGYLGFADAYSLNYTVIPRKGTLGYLTTWPAGQTQPVVSTLNAPGGQVTANAAIVPAGTAGSVSVFVTHDTDLVIDINGFFAPPGIFLGLGGLSFYPLAPCRVRDTRNPPGTPPFSGAIDVNVVAGGCGAPASAQAFAMNATVVPSSSLGFLTLWPQGMPQPLASTLNAGDGAVTSNLAIVPASNGSISAYGSSPTHLVLDISGYFAY